MIFLRLLLRRKGNLCIGTSDLVPSSREAAAAIAKYLFVWELSCIFITFQNNVNKEDNMAYLSELMRMSVRIYI